MFAFELTYSDIKLADAVVNVVLDQSWYTYRRSRVGIAHRAVYIAPLGECKKKICVLRTVANATVVLKYICLAHVRLGPLIFEISNFNAIFYAICIDYGSRLWRDTPSSNG